MSRRMYILVAALGVLALLGAACSSNKSSSPPPASSSAPTGNTVQATTELSFSPVTLNVKKGDTVTWNNSSGVAHNVTFENGAAFAQALNSGAQVQRAFTTTGTFNYFCSIHGKSMHGTIVVT